jgi:hypothetical protein
MKSSLFLCSLFFFSVTLVHADLYQWTDEQGVIHVVDDAGTVPEAYRATMKTYHSPKPAKSSTSLLAPSRAYAERSQGAFAQKLALDLGLINNTSEDALGPLGAAGIQPAGGWRVDDPLSPEAYDEVVTAARRAADSQRVRLSADGAEGVVRQAAANFLPPAPVVRTQSQPEEQEYEAPEVIVEQQPPQVIEVIQEPVYVPQEEIVGVPWWGGFPGGRLPHNPHHHPHQNPPPKEPQFSTPAPTHMPFGASHMPFGASRTPSGSTRESR